MSYYDNSSAALNAARAIAAAVVLLAACHPADAHALLRKADPPVGSTVHAAPAEVTILFSESVEPGFSTIEVHDAGGARVDAGNVHTAPGDGKELVVGLKALAPGNYAVEWHVVSTDTHRTTGRYNFQVAP